MIAQAAVGTARQLLFISTVGFLKDELVFILCYGRVLQSKIE